MTQEREHRSRKRSSDREFVKDFGPPALFVLLAVLIPIFILPQKPPLELIIILDWTILAYSSFHLARIVRERDPAWMKAVLHSFSYVWLGLAAVVQETLNRNPYGLIVADRDAVIASLVILVGLVVYDLTWSVNRRRSTRNQTSRGAFDRQLDPKRVALLCILALVVTPLYISTVGSSFVAGLETLFLPRNVRVATISAMGTGDGGSMAIGGLSFAIGSVPPVVSLVGLIRIYTTHVKVRRLPIYWAAVMAMALLVIVVTNPIGNSRFWAGTAAMGLVLSTNFAQRPQVWRLLLVVWVLALTLAFPYADRYRNAEVTQSVQTPATFFAKKGDYDASSQVGHAIAYRREVGSTDGSQLLGAALFWVPRSLWKDKPDASGPLIARFIGYRYENISSPLWAESYMDGGVVLVVIVFFGVGTVSGRIDSTRPGSAKRGTDLRSLAYPLVATYSLILLRGSLLGVIGPFALMCTLLFLVTKRDHAKASQV